MKGICFEKWCPREHLIYAPSAPIAKKIAPDNWQEVAILRGGQYIYIARGFKSTDEDNNWRYVVDVSPDHALSNDFAELEEAIEYAHSL